MAVTSTRTMVITFTGDVQETQPVNAATNATSPGVTTIIASLASGFNAITVLTAAGFVPTAVTIIPPAANVVTLTLKGITGDTGIALHLTDPTTIALAASVTTFGLTVGAAGIVGLRLIWS
jgi:hypothetical protein